MTAFNVVRFRVKPGREEHFIAAHKDARANFKGFRSGALIKTGEQTYCIVAEWTSFAKLAAARPQMIALLDSFRGDLEDLGNGLGVTDAVSGEVVLKLAVPKPAKKGTKPKKAKRKNRR
jgi:hypothetical protein